MCTSMNTLPEHKRQQNHRGRHQHHLPAGPPLLPEPLRQHPRVSIPAARRAGHHVPDDDEVDGEGPEGVERDEHVEQRGPGAAERVAHQRRAGCTGA
uniref:Uncharacterized protein n=1 Tax=Arundo donax TaxID=35708 RepID=A0A0A8ZFJ1_ARUDO